MLQDWVYSTGYTEWVTKDGLNMRGYTWRGTQDGLTQDGLHRTDYTGGSTREGLHRMAYTWGATHDGVTQGGFRRWMYTGRVTEEGLYSRGCVALDYIFPTYITVINQGYV